MTGRHAYLVMAHSEPEILRILVSLVDDPRNDIFIHLDKKCNSNDFSEVKAECSGLFFLEKRIDVRWGCNLLDAEFLLMKTARHHSDYSYYHLISGVDLPLHNQDYIHSVIDLLGGGWNSFPLRLTTT